MLELHLERLKDLLCDQMDQQTSAWLYGSATTGSWAPGRSDLDLIVLIPEEKLDLFGQKVRSWDRVPTNPILDGYAVYLSGRSLKAIHLEQLAKFRHPSPTFIGLVDQWYIKNRSKHLFGSGSLNTYFPDVTLDQLRAWALRELKNLSEKGNARSCIPKLSSLIWSVSWTARLLMLSRGDVCESKLEALQWLANENNEGDDISNLIGLLLENFHKSDDASVAITSEQDLLLSRFCIDLARRETRIPS